VIVTLTTFRRNALVVAAVFVVIVVSVLLMLNSASARAAEVVRLTNGKEVRIGQSRGALQKNFGSALRPITNEIYRYPAAVDKPAEATIYLTGGKVSAIMVTRGAGNSQLIEGGIRLGASGKQLQERFGKKLDAIDTQSDPVVQRGYKVVNPKTVSYYVTESCTGPRYDRVTVLAVSEKGAENNMAFLGKKRNCSNVSDQTQAAQPS
jgi:hypothetical protein